MNKIEIYKKYLEENNYSNNTIRTYINVVKKISENEIDVQKIKDELSKIENANTAITKYNIIMAYFRFLEKEEKIKELATFRLPKKTLEYRSVITYKELYRLTDINEKDTEYDITKKMVIRFLFETGVRISEIYQITSIGENYLKLKGKGNKQREVFHNKETTEKLSMFFENKPTSKTIRLWVKEILGEQYSPHSLRRSFATHMLTSGASPKMVQQQMGHSKIETTFSYLNLSPERNQNIYNEFMQGEEK